MNTALRRIRGALGNAVVWGAVWFGATAALVAGANLLFGGRFYLPSMLFSSTMVGAVGALTGGMFSAYVAANFKRSRLDDLSPLGIAVGGGLVATLVALILIVVLSGVTGNWSLLGLTDVAFPVGFSAVLGSLTGSSSIKLAQRALPEAEDPKQLE